MKSRMTGFSTCTESRPLHATGAAWPVCARSAGSAAAGARLRELSRVRSRSLAVHASPSSVVVRPSSDLRGLVPTPWPVLRARRTRARRGEMEGAQLAGCPPGRAMKSRLGRDFGPRWTAARRVRAVARRCGRALTTCRDAV